MLFSLLIVICVRVVNFWRGLRTNKTDLGVQGYMFTHQQLTIPLSCLLHSQSASQCSIQSIGTSILAYLRVQGFVRWFCKLFIIYNMQLVIQKANDKGKRHKDSNQLGENHYKDTRFSKTASIQPLCKVTILTDSTLLGIQMRNSLIFSLDYYFLLLVILLFSESEMPMYVFDAYSLFIILILIIIRIMNFLLKKVYKSFATLAIAEHNGKSLTKNTLKLLSASNKLKDQTHLLVCGEHTEQLIGDIKRYSGSNITQVIRSNSKNILAEQVTAIAKDLLAKGTYKNVIGLSSSIGKDIIPRLAGYHAAQPIGDIIEVIDQNTYLRPTYAGNALTKVKTTQTINFLTFRSSSFDEVGLADGNPEIKNIQTPSGVKTHFVKQETSDSGRPDLTTARIVVSGGRGVKSKQNFNIINELANAFGNAAVGASRAAVDAGYCPNEMQVGQTGKVVAPELYVAVGISGAVQHLAGMKDSKVIVAINTKSDEPIFQIANYGLEADLFKAVPQLTQKLNKLKGK